MRQQLRAALACDQLLFEFDTITAGATPDEQFDQDHVADLDRVDGPRKHVGLRSGRPAVAAQPRTTHVHAYAVGSDEMSNTTNSPASMIFELAF